MAGLDPAIHVFVLYVKKKDVDARDKRGMTGKLTCVARDRGKERRS
jgi:hypothetical protein